MKKITFRTIVCLILAAFLLFGTCAFLFHYFKDGGDWVSYSANRHMYTDGVLNSGRILDRDGELLAGYAEGGWQYNESYSVRRATLHAVGDPKGMIGTGALTVFADKLTGYNLLTGSEPLLNAERQVYLTIDADVCRAAYRALDGRNGAVGVYNYKTGEILCMVSGPSYDPLKPPAEGSGSSTLFGGGYVNHFLSSRFIPGSTFKLVTAAAALERIPDIDTRMFTCEGSYTVDGVEVTCPNPHGELTLGEALSESCNCTFAQLSEELGPALLEKYADRAGLTRVYSVSSVKTKKSKFDFYNDNIWAGIGQGKDLVNPCSMMIYAGAIANGGKAAIPQFLLRSELAGKVRTSIYITHSTNRLLHKPTAAALKQMMLDNVTNHYGAGNYPGLVLGAKSGTAQTGENGMNNAWFVGFLDDPSHPYAFAVLVETAGSGSGAAGSVANAVLQAAVK